MDRGPSSSDPAGPEEEGPRSAVGAGGRRVRRRVPRWLWGAGVVVLLLALVNLFVLEPFEVPSASMEPALRPGDRIVVDKLAYRSTEPRRGDVVVFDGTEIFGGGDVVKRVLGVGGDRVRCCDSRGRLRVNGRPLREARYLFPGDRPSTARFSVTVPEGRLWLMGDHRSRSRDSRDHLGSPGGGMVPVDRVIGRVRWVVWPVGRWQSVR